MIHSWNRIKTLTKQRKMNWWDTFHITCKINWFKLENRKCPVSNYEFGSKMYRLFLTKYIWPKMTVEANFEVGFFIVYTFWAMICVCTFNWYKISHLFHCFGLCKNQHILKVNKLRTGNSEKFHMWYMQCKYLWIKPLWILMFFVLQMLFTMNKNLSWIDFVKKIYYIYKYVQILLKHKFKSYDYHTLRLTVFPPFNIIWNTFLMSYTLVTSVLIWSEHSWRFRSKFLNSCKILMPSEKFWP